MPDTDEQSRIREEILSRYHRRGHEIPEPEKKPMTKTTLKNVMLRLTSEEYSRLNDARRRNNLSGLSDNQIVRKLLFDQLDQEEKTHESKQQRHAPAVGLA